MADIARGENPWGLTGGGEREPGSEHTRLLKEKLPEAGVGDVNHRDRVRLPVEGLTRPAELSLLRPGLPATVTLG